VCTPRHEWCRVKPVVLALLRNTLATFPEGPDGNAIGATPLPLPPVLGQQPVDVQWYIDALDSFGQHPPFTVQRLCELLLNPQQHYVRKHKLCHALEKLLMVTSCQPAGPAAAIMSDRAANARAAAEASRQAAAAAAAVLAAAAGVHSVAEGGGGFSSAAAGVGPHPTVAGSQDGWDADMRVDAGMRPSERAEQQQDGKAAAHIASRAACGPDNNGVSAMSHVVTGGSAQALHAGTAV
jgi:PPP4R2